MTGVRVAAALTLLSLPAGLAGQDQTFRATTTAVLIDVAVRQRDRAVLDLSAGDFELFDNGVRQTVTLLSVDQPMPIDLVALVDVSDSVSERVRDPGAERYEFQKNERPLLEPMRRAVSALPDLLLPRDRFEMMTFDARLRRVTQDGPIERSPEPEFRRTALWDSVAAAMMHPADPGRRRVIAVFTDAIDTHSVLNYRTLGAVAGRTDAVLHLFALMDRAWQPARHYYVRSAGEERLAPSGMEPFSTYTWFLRAAAAQTGGRHHAIFTDENIIGLVRSALGELRQRYVLSYTPTGVEPGGWHDVEVRVTRPGRFDVDARRGYVWQ